MDSTLVAPRNIAFTQKVTRKEPATPQAASENIFDRKVPLGFAYAILAPVWLSVLACGVLVGLNALGVLPSR